MTSSSVAPSPSGAGGAPVERADVIVVGAGPGGSATAAYLADHGLDVVLLEKSAFPRDKICGDGLTPRATKELISLGVDTTGWQRTKGLRIKGGGHTLQLDWPESDAFPGYGMVRTRAQLDETLARHAVSRGAQLHERTSVSAPVRDGSGRVTGVSAKRVDEAGRATGETVTYRAPVVVASDGVSSRLATAVGRPKREDRVMGVAVRAYYTTPQARRLPREPPRAVEPRRRRQPHPHARLRLALPARGRPHQRRPRHPRHHLGLPEDGLQGRHAPVGRGHQPRVAARARRVLAGPIRGAALPMGFNRTPLYADGLLLVGDSGGMVNPFNGEGIDYALEAARLGAELVAQAMARPSDAARERVLAAYPKVMKDELGGYFTLGRWFAHAIGNPEVMRLATKYGLPRTKLMPLLLKIMANLADPHEQGRRATASSPPSRDWRPAHEPPLRGRDCDAEHHRDGRP